MSTPPLPCDPQLCFPPFLPPLPQLAPPPACDMGNATTSHQVTCAPGKLSQRRRKDDQAKLDDFLSRQEEDRWAAPKKPSVRKLYLARSVRHRYAHLPVPEAGDCCVNRGEMINPGFVDDQSS